MENKKIGIITLYGNFNYGNKLQNYALQEAVKKLGYTSETIRIGHNNFKDSTKQMLKNNIKFILKPKLQIMRNRRKNRFKDFSAKFLCESKDKYDYYANLSHLEKKYHSFIVGSDQVWNPKMNRNSDAFLLNFCKNYMKNSYAASFGVREIPDTLKEKFRNNLSSFNCLSVREDEGAEIVEDLLGVKPKVVLDPTMLLSEKEWERIIKEPKKIPNKKYILTYFLGENEESVEQILSDVNYNNDFEIVNLHSEKINEYYFTDPSEFLWLVKNSSLFLTDSFHGVVFSLVFKKSFIVFKRVGGEGMYARIETILKKFNLLNREVNHVISTKDYFSTNYENLSSILEKEINYSMNFLENCLTKSISKNLNNNSMTKEAFEEIKKYSDASGTSTIVDPRIKIKLNEFGYYEEDLSLLSSEEFIDPNVLKVIPNFNKELNEDDISKELYNDIKDIHYDKRIGYYKSLYIGHVNDLRIRKTASSGGIASWLLKELISKNYVDYVIHVKKADYKIDGVLFKYDISSTIDEVMNGAKTKYYPVELSDVLKFVQENEGRYAIVGIPSFIMSVRLLQNIDDIFKNRIKYTIGLICGHQKSSKFAESMAWQSGIEPGNLVDFDFRRKIQNRPASMYGVTIKGYMNGKLTVIEKEKRELIGQNWGEGFFKVFSSDYTDDVMNETADITIGDAWLPEYTNDSLGNSILIIRNPILDKIIKNSIEANTLSLESKDKEIIFKSQAAHFRHTQDELSYRLYKREKKKEWVPKFRVEPNNDLPLTRKLIQDYREKISYFSHIHFKEAVRLNDFNCFRNEMLKVSKMYLLIYRFERLRTNGFSIIMNKLKTRK